VFSFGMEPGAGPGLLFMTIPLVFSQMPFGSVLLVAFFFLTAIAATTAMLSLVEVPVAYWSEERGMSRKKAAVLNAVLIAIVGVLATLSVDKASLLGNVTFFGMGFFDLFDYISSNILLPLGGLFIALMMGYSIKRDEVVAELSNNGKLKVAKLVSVYFFLIRYVTPLLLIVVFLNAIGILKF
jgi:NSS family neurotransmitter:Na+ symporter